MDTVSHWRDALRRSWRRHRRRRQVRRELADYRSPRERAELQAILERYDMTPEEVVRSVGAEPERVPARVPPIPRQRRA